MNIILTANFIVRLNRILDFIAKDSPNRAIIFRDKILAQIESLTFMPFRCRKNGILGDENVRDLIYKGYVVVFRINEDNIEILEIFKENLPKF